jgi:hypothetical protein
VFGNGDEYPDTLGPFLITPGPGSKYKITSGTTSFTASPNTRQITTIVATTSSLSITFRYASNTPTGITWLNNTVQTGTYTVDSSTNSISIMISMRYTFSDGSSSSSTKFAPTVMLYSYDTSQLYCHIRVYWGNGNTATTCEVKVQLSGSNSASTYICTRSSTSDMVTFTITQILLSQLSKYTCTVTSYS